MNGLPLITIMIIFIGLSALITPSVAKPTVDVITSGVLLSTDKELYISGEKITVSGRVSELHTGFQVALQIISPQGNLVRVDQLKVGPDRTFTTTITTGGNLWKESGTYIIFVQYGLKSQSAQATFQFQTSGATPSPEKQTRPMPSKQKIELPNEENKEQPKGVDYQLLLIMAGIAVGVSILIGLFVAKSGKIRSGDNSAEIERIKKQEREELERIKELERRRAQKKQQPESDKVTGDETPTEPPKVSPRYKRESPRTIIEGKGERNSNTEKQPSAEDEDVRKKQRDEKKKREESKPKEPPSPKTISGEANPYEILGVGQNATCAELKSQFKKLAKKHSPDPGMLNMTEEEKKRKTAMFIKVMKAYDELKKLHNCKD